VSQKKSKRGGFFGKLFGAEEVDSNAEKQQTSVSDQTDQIETVPDAVLEPTPEHSTAQNITENAADGDVIQGAADAQSVLDRTESDADLKEAQSTQNSEPDLAPAPQSAPKKQSWIARLSKGLSKTSSRLGQGITSLFTQQKLDEDTLDDFEDILIQADLGVETATRIRDQISGGRYDKGITSEDVQTILATEVERVLEPTAKALEINPSHGPHVILVVGVNGSGKTTTIGKLAAQYKSDGHNVMIAAGDTFRAAAIDQLKVWGERADVRVMSSAVGSDASGLAYDALQAAQAEGVDVLLVDTAGRLQNKQALMEELEKVIRVIRKLSPEAPHDSLLVLDATTGQNAMGQVEAFRSTAGVSGLIMTKLDGTARGGILVAIAAKYGLPVHAIGVGEGIDDLQPFDAADFAAAITGR